MAKLNSGKTITISINGKKRLFQEEPVKIEPKSDENNREKEPKSELPAFEKIRHDEAAASKELSDESFDWVLPEEEEANQNESSELKVVSSTNEVKMKPGSFRPMILAAVFAVLLGTSFGVFMLKLVSTEQSKHTTQATPVASNNVNKSSPAATSGASFSLKPWTAYIVQGGMYSTKDTAKRALSQMTDNGIPAAAIESDGKQYVLIGAANTMEEAKSLGEYLHKKGTIDVYPRTLAVPEKKLSQLNHDEKAFIKDAAAIFPILTKTTATTLTASANLSKETLKAITNLETDIAKISSKQLHSEQLRRLKTEITAAADQVKVYQKKNDKTALTAAQQHLITFLSIYYSF